MSDPPVTACEVCGDGPVEKVLFPVAVHFKGKGFYSTDYGRGSGGAPAKEGAKETASSGKESSGGDTGTSGGEKKASGGDAGSGTSSAKD
jgi:predicted nucleic acid-binding Zn ribbon protein